MRVHAAVVMGAAVLLALVAAAGVYVGAVHMPAQMEREYYRGVYAECQTALGAVAGISPYQERSHAFCNNEVWSFMDKQRRAETPPGFEWPNPGKQHVP